MIDCVLELTTAVKTQIANQHEVTEGREGQEGVKTRDFYVEFVFLSLVKCWLSSSELSIWKSKPNCCQAEGRMRSEVLSVLSCFCFHGGLDFTEGILSCFPGGVLEELVWEGEEAPTLEGTPLS